MIRFMRAAATIVFVTIAMAGCDSVEERVARHAERGAALVAEGDDARARLEFRNALELQESHAPSRLALAGIYEREGEFAAARANYALAAELDRSDAESRWRLARLDLLLGRIDAAAAAAQEAVEISPGNVDAVAMLASSRLSQKRVDEAAALAERALSLDAANVMAHVAAAAAKLALGDAAGALVVADLGLAAASKNLSLNLTRLRALEALGDGSAIDAQLASMAELFPNQPEFGAALARLRIDAGDIDGAEQALRERAARSDDPDLTLDVVRFLNESSGRDAAVTALIAEIDASGDAPPPALLVFALSQLLNEGGEAEAAERTLREFIERAEAPEEADEGRVRLARLALARDDAEEAAALLETVLSRDAEHVGALALRAAIQIEDYELEPAIENLRRAQSLAPENSTLLVLEARALERAGEPALARDRLAAATRVSGHAPMIAAAYARTLVAAGQQEAALSILAETARRWPEDAQTLARFAALRLAAGDWAGARDVATQLRALDSPGAVVTADRIEATALEGLGLHAESVALLERAAEADSVALTALMQRRLQAGDVAGATAAVDARLEQAPDDGRAQVLRAELELRAGDVASAEARLERLSAKQPDDPSGPLALARLRLAQGDLSRAESAARAGLEANSGATALRLMLAGILEERGEIDGAIAEYEKLYETSPDTPLVANNLASLILERSGDDPAALDRAETIATRLEGLDQPYFRDTIGWIRFLRGDAAEALPDLEAAAGALPNNPVVQYHFGRALAALGRNDAARERLRRALEIDAGFAKADSARAALQALPGGP